jgi:cell wall assembly regulator SMI1
VHVLPDFEFVSVSQSVAACRFLRQPAEEDADPGWDPDTAWATQWIPIFVMGTGGFVALDCRGPTDGPSPVRTVRPDTAYGPDHAPVIAPSLGELLAGASRWMQQGTCRFEPEQGLWWPLEAWIDQSDAERYGLPRAEG